jgi:hypothetical protein
MENFSMAISGDWAVLGNYLDGVAHLYHHTGGGWQHTQTLDTPLRDRPDYEPYRYMDFYGIAVAIQGQRLVVGSNLETELYVYGLQDNTWRFEQALFSAPASQWQGGWSTNPFGAGNITEYLVKPGTSQDIITTPFNNVYKYQEGSWQLAYAEGDCTGLVFKVSGRRFVTFGVGFVYNQFPLRAGVIK